MLCVGGCIISRGGDAATGGGGGGCSDFTSLSSRPLLSRALRVGGPVDVTGQDSRGTAAAGGTAAVLPAKKGKSNVNGTTYQYRQGFETGAARSQGIWLKPEPPGAGVFIYVYVQYIRHFFNSSKK